MAINKKELDGLLKDDKGLGFFVGLRFFQSHPTIAEEVLAAGFADTSPSTIAMVDAILVLVSETIIEKAPA